MKKHSRILAVFLLAALALSGCSGRAANEAQEAEWETTSTVSVPASPEPGFEVVPTAQEQSAGASETDSRQPRYIEQLVLDTVAEIEQPGMSEYEKVKAAFDYMIETMTLIDPMGLELWRIRGDDTEPLSYVENRSLSVLQFHLGKCEDYAAALTMLLRGMGLEAEYVPGLTYSTQGEWVDHAWTVVRVDGTWYHVDSQLEQKISRHGSVRYKYFMRGDTTMAGSHRWGQNLIDSRLLTTTQNEEIAQGYLPPACPQDYPTPQRYSFTPPPEPDMDAIAAQIEAELQEYERVNGQLEPMEINTIPPVFGVEGFGPQD